MNKPTNAEIVTKVINSFWGKKFTSKMIVDATQRLNGMIPARSVYTYLSHAKSAGALTSQLMKGSRHLHEYTLQRRMTTVDLISPYVQALKAATKPVATPVTIASIVAKVAKPVVSTKKPVEDYKIFKNTADNASDTMKIKSNLKKMKVGESFLAPKKTWISSLIYTKGGPGKFSVKQDKDNSDKYVVTRKRA